MITLTGEVRKVLDHGYTDRGGNRVRQAKVIIEPSEGAQNYEVFLPASQVKNGLRDAWEKLIGNTVSVPVNLYVNHDYKFYKFTAVDGHPVAEKRS